MPVIHSRTVATVLKNPAQDRLRVIFLQLRIRPGCCRESYLHRIEHKSTTWKCADRDRVVQLLHDAGLTVRFFDEEEQRWMETSQETGPTPIKGNRDGQWGEPTKEEFEKSYLGPH